MTSQPIFSIVIPCYNQGSFIDEAIQSVSTSTNLSYEILVINDGSTEPNTLSKLNTLRARQSDELRIIDKENGGLASARNLGFSEAQGYFVKFLDADDLLTRGILDHQRDLFNNHASVDVVINEFIYCDFDRSHFWGEMPSTISGFEFTWEDFFYCWENGLTIPIHSALFRKSSLPPTPFRPGLRAKEDWVFWCDISAQNLKMLYSSSVGCVYRVHETNMTKNVTYMASSWIEALQININHGEASGKDINPARLNKQLTHFNNFYLAQIGNLNSTVRATTLSKIFGIWS